ncbi:hypothetical protein J3459_010707 [Metarhizium acridum]|nr:hypothetical protein J3459_010707 [Metarhizium acridum]
MKRFRSIFSKATKLNFLRCESDLSKYEKLMERSASGQPERVDWEITEKRRNFSNINWEETEALQDGPEVSPTDDEYCLTMKDVHPACDTSDAQEAIRRFYDTLCDHWPFHCGDTHRSMLRLVGHRQYISEDGRAAHTFEFDTLSSSHNRHWGRIKFLAEVPQRRRKVAFEGIADQENPNRPTPVDLCQTIERSAREKMCYFVNFGCGQSSKLPGHLPIILREPLIGLGNLLQAGDADQVTCGYQLSLREKALVAVIFASTLLQLSKGAWGKGALDEGPWLQRNWTENGIQFLLNIDNKPILDEAYLPIIFNGPPDGSTFNCSTSSFLALAITLLQLSNSEVVQKFNAIRKEILQLEEVKETENDQIDRWALHHLMTVDTFTALVDDQYQKAIKACISGKLATDLGQVEEGIVQECFEQEVILPLKNYLEKMMGPEQAMASMRRNLVSQTKHSRQFQEGNWCCSSDKSDDEGRHSIDEENAKYAKQWFHMFEAKVYELVKLQPEDDVRGTSSPARIKIAILDTGIQFPREAFDLFGDQIIEYKSWIQCNEDRSELDGGHGDLDGHGTHCASVLLNVAKNAHIYVARVFRARTERNMDDNATNKAIAEALSYAIDKWQVDIITMSFGRPDRVECINSQIQRARDRGILMVSAASNAGGLGTISWPAKAQDVICVHALDGYGNGTNFTPSPRPHNHNFAAPGVSIEGYWPTHLSPSRKPFQYMSGTSCATPIVAGILAVLLEYVRKHETKYGYYADLFKRLREKEGVVTILGKMTSTEKRNKYQFLEPWKLLDAQDEFQNDDIRMKEIIRLLKSVG